MMLLRQRYHEFISDKLNALRLHGNKAAHGDEPSSQTASWLLKEAFDVARWLSVQFKKTTVADPKNFHQFHQIFK